jgi:hypothetical protein
MQSMPENEDPSKSVAEERFNFSATMFDRVPIANGGRMNVSQLRPMHPSQRFSIKLRVPELIPSDSSQDALRRRIQRIETLLHGSQPVTEPQRTISSALTGIEKLLGIPPLENEQKHTILMPLLREPAVSPTTLPSPAGSHSSQLRTAFLAEANHKRWGADSAIGQSWSKV